MIISIVREPDSGSKPSSGCLAVSYMHIVDCDVKQQSIKQTLLLELPIELMGATASMETLRFGLKAGVSMEAGKRTVLFWPQQVRP